MAKIVLDLHDIFNKGSTIDAELNRVIAEAIEKKIALVEIILGKGSGQLKKRVLRFLLQPEVKKLYHRLEKDDKNFGRIFVHFKY
ncbi:MAG: Smr/MutS family protein [Chloroflexi bacterium]|nr:Smr/MutS family protein [Chloroflexota bacterium]